MEGLLPGERLRATGSLLLAEWESASAADGQPMHCLTPRYALRAAQKMVLEAVERDRRGGSGGSALSALQPAYTGFHG